MCGRRMLGARFGEVLKKEGKLLLRHQHRRDHPHRVLSKNFLLRGQRSYPGHKPWRLYNTLILCKIIKTL